MANSVAVALIGDLSDRQHGVGDELMNVPYADLEKFELDVADDETLGSVLERAARHWDVPYYRHVVAFYRPDHGLTGHATRWRGMLPLVDSRGRVSWGHSFETIQYAELRRSGEAGALDGDPRRPYLILQPPAGNGVLPDWPTLISFLDVVWYRRRPISATWLEPSSSSSSGRSGALRRGRGAGGRCLPRARHKPRWGAGVLRDERGRGRLPDGDRLKDRPHPADDHPDPRNHDLWRGA
jgi:hypothetical protein